MNTECEKLLAEAKDRVRLITTNLPTIVDEQIALLANMSRQHELEGKRTDIPAIAETFEDELPNALRAGKQLVENLTGRD